MKSKEEYKAIIKAKLKELDNEFSKFDKVLDSKSEQLEDKGDELLNEIKAEKAKLEKEHPEFFESAERTWEEMQEFTDEIGSKVESWIKQLNK